MFLKKTFLIVLDPENAYLASLQLHLQKPISLQQVFSTIIVTLTIFEI